MKVMVIGSGGREHAIAWKLSQSGQVDKIYCAPGNGGTELENKCENINLNSDDELLNFALQNNVDITVVGPEAPLVSGIADKFEAQGLKIFGPCKKAAMLEGSKAFSKEFMKKYGVKTASYEVFNHAEDSIEYLKTSSYPIVIKADGLAAGKGVVICSNFKEASEAVSEFMVNDKLKGAGKKLVIEEFLEGMEASILAVTDGKTIIPLMSAKDHKTIFEENKGPNTGGMGAISPNPYCTLKVLESFKKDIMEPTIEGIKKEGMKYIGIIFFGLMINEKGVYLLEYNVRMGDPETQAVLPLMESDLMDVIMHAVDGNLQDYDIKWKDKYACSVVAASHGYPGKYDTGFSIEGINADDSKVFVAGARMENGTLKTSGGRVLAVTTLGDTSEEARRNAYASIDKINFKGMYYRKDIGIIR